MSEQQNPPKIRSIVIDTVTKIQDNQYMTDVRKPGHDKWKDYSSELWSFCLELQKRGFELILIIGPPGTGKSSGMRNLPSKTNIWYNVDNKNPVWIGGKQEYGKKNDPVKNYHVIPEHYSDILNHIDGAIKAGMLEQEKFAFLFGHTENFREGVDQRVRLKTLGNLNNKMQIEGNFETVLYSVVEMDNGTPKYLLETQNNGFNTCRSPMGLFEGKIDNDLNFVVNSLLEF